MTVTISVPPEVSRTHDVSGRREGSGEVGHDTRRRAEPHDPLLPAGALWIGQADDAQAGLGAQLRIAPHDRLRLGRSPGTRSGSGSPVPASRARCSRACSSSG
jgi:hypothetical protein